MQRHVQSPLRGRDDEIAALHGFLSNVRAGTGATVIIEGSPGLGKTRLLEECAALAAGMSFRVGHGSADPGPLTDALGALYEALFEGDTPLADRSALSDLHASPEYLFWHLQDVQALIEEAALDSPVLLCLDDLHWSTATFAVAMRQLLPRLASLPVAWAMTFRPDQGPHQVQKAKSAMIQSGTHLIRLGPVERDAVAQIAEDVLGAQVD